MSMWWLVMTLAWQSTPSISKIDGEKIWAATEEALQKQRASIEFQLGASGGVKRQMDSVRVQIKTIRPNLPDAPLGFYSVPWMNADAAPGPRYTCPPPGNLNAQIDRIATQEGVDSTLVREVVRQESAFDPCAVSPKGAAGLMQLMPRTQQQMHVSDAFDVVQNLTAGSRLLRQLLERYDGDIVSALAAYNAGPKKVDEAGGVPALAETRKYVNKILDRLPNR